MVPMLIPWSFKKQMIPESNELLQYRGSIISDPLPCPFLKCEARGDVEWNSNQDDERESNESKPILLVPAHISILWSFFCTTIHCMISHKLGNCRHFSRVGYGI